MTKFSIKFSRIAFTLLIVGFIFLSSFIFLYTPKLKKRFHKSEHVPAISFINVEISHFENEKLLWQLKSDWATVDPSHSHITFRESLYKHYSNDQINFMALAHGGTLSMESSSLALDKALIFHLGTENLYNFKADKLTWDAEKKIAIGMGNTILYHQNFIVTANQFLYNFSTQSVQLLGKPEAIIQDAL